MIPRSTPARLLVLALLCVVAYAPLLTIPLIEDDYPTLALARQYGSPADVGALFHDPVYRVRATTFWIMWAVYRLAGLVPWAYRLASLAFHIGSAWMLYALAREWPPMRQAAFWAAAFFAVQEGHQEAVVWFAGFTEPAQFFFGIAALVCWLRSNPAGLLLFALALVSKESAIILLPLFVLVIPPAEWRKAIPRLAPYIVLGLIAAFSIAAGRANSFRFTDGSFSLRAPFWITWPRGIGRVLWIWGWLALLVIFRAKEPKLARAGLTALAWVAIALLPYSFLTYSTQIPSRQTYLASAGLALVFGLAASYLCRRPGLPRAAIAGIVCVVLAHNLGILWFKKRGQFLERAEPTEQLIRMARQTSGPIYMRCFPRNHYIAEEAVQQAAGLSPGDLIWTPAEAAKRSPAATFCYQEKARTAFSE